MFHMIAKTVFLAILVQFVAGNTIHDWHRSFHRAYIAKRCNPNIEHPGCCQFSPPCAVRYVVRGWWSTGIDTTSAPLSCQWQCSKHHTQCLSRCEYGLYVNEVTSKDPCKCVVDKGILFKLREKCHSVCKSAKEECKSGCEKPPKCPSKAYTVLAFDKTVEGKCAAICPKKKAVDSIALPKCWVLALCQVWVRIKEGNALGINYSIHMLSQASNDRWEK